MNLKAILTDEEAVSPVIGVVLMVAITVLLAATAATFFLGLTQENTTSTPRAAFAYDYDADAGSSPASDELQVKHTNGDTLDAEDIVLDVSDASYSDGSGDHDLDVRASWADLGGSGGKISAGDSAMVTASSVDSEMSATPNSIDLTGASVDVIWEDPGGSKTVNLDTWNP